MLKLLIDQFTERIWSWSTGTILQSNRVLWAQLERLCYGNNYLISRQVVQLGEYSILVQIDICTHKNPKYYRMVELHISHNKSLWYNSFLLVFNLKTTFLWHNIYTIIYKAMFSFEICLKRNYKLTLLNNRVCGIFPWYNLGNI